MITVGLVGGIACGKSLVAQDFQSLGACVLDGDRVGHEVLRLDFVRDKIAKKWGKRVIGEDGHLDRAALGKIVFAPKANGALEFLESVTHPEIEQRLVQRLDQARHLGRFPLAVLDAAVMFKSGWDRHCGKIVFVHAPATLRKQRALLRGMSAAQFSEREGRQTPLKEKKAKADIFIDNSGTPHETYQQVQTVWHSLVEIA